MKAFALAAGLALAALSAAAPAIAQERIVVTGARISDELAGRYVIPHSGVTRRADFLLRTLYVSCDTRDADARDDELRRTLRGMLTRAGRETAIELAEIVDVGDDGYAYDESLDSLVVPFTEDAIGRPFASGFRGRSDTSYIQLQVKTAIEDDDTLDAAAGRIQTFVDDVERVGRSALDLDDDDVLSVVDPEQYRDYIFAVMAEDANARAAALGPDYRARFEGLENQVSWYRAGVLEVRLFIAHHLTIVPAGE